MEILFYSAIVFLLSIILILNSKFKYWNNTYLNFLFANRSLKILESGLAISSHWFWAIAIFVGPAVAYNWGIIGLIWFVVPNAISLIIVGLITNKIRQRHDDGFSLTSYIKTKFDKKLEVLFQIEFIIVSFAALLLAFTAINKLWIFTELNQVLDSIYFSLIVGLITLYFTFRGGIRTSIFTGALQTILWLSFLAVTYSVIFSSDVNLLSYGKNNLLSFLDYTFLTSFAITWLISILVGASSHGMMWQKSFSMPRENILPSYFLASIIFLIICTAVSSLGMIAYSNSINIQSSDTSQLSTLFSIIGPIGVILFGILLIGQTSTVIDSSLNYVASLVSNEWLNDKSIKISQFTMIGFLLLAWIVSWLQLEIWTILLLMSSIRIVMFVPLLAHTVNSYTKNQSYFYCLIFSILISFILFVIARLNAIPILEMIAAIQGILVPFLFLFLVPKKS